MSLAIVKGTGKLMTRNNVYSKVSDGIWPTILY